MLRAGTRFLFFFLSAALLLAKPREPHRGSNLVAPVRVASGPDAMKRPVTVTDGIRMTRFGDPTYTAGGSSKGIVAKFSPDTTQFVTVLRKGNLENNTNEYSLLLFRIADLFHSPAPHVLASLASSSNRPGIQNPIWLEDNDTILFSGENPGEHAQLYSLKSRSGALRQVTNNPTNITSFASSNTGDLIAYVAESPVSNFATEKALHNGFLVTHERLWDLIKGSFGGDEYSQHELFIHNTATAEDRRVRINGEIEGPNPRIALSPNGKYLLVQTEVRRIPEGWRDYEGKFLRLYTGQPPTEGAPTNVFQYELLDTDTGTSESLLGTPWPDGGSDVAWSPDSKSVVVSNAYLPLNADDSLERTVRKAHTLLVEVSVPDRKLAVVSDEHLRLLRWDASSGNVICEKSIDAAGNRNPEVHFHKKLGMWSQVEASAKAAPLLPEIILDEDMNTPPRIVAIDPTSRRKSLLIDLNPQFGDLAFAKVQSVTWKDTLGNEAKGGLYWPLNYVVGRKYPLVIQTHWWYADKFLIDGPFTTAFAAQALAGKGFFVLQDHGPDWTVFDTTDEGPRAMADYEGAIEYLDQRGLIDRTRVGIIGFSRTCYHITYTLTHSNYKFAAATIADGIDGGYFQQMAFSNAIPDLAIEFDALNGAPPFGGGLSTWMKQSPPFLMERVQAPLLVQANNGPVSLLGEWEWFAGLSRLKKPVELIYLPHGTHILEKPWEREVSQQATVDWFDFWLNRHEDPDTAKAEKYKRWRELRKLQEANGAVQKPN